MLNLTTQEAQRAYLLESIRTSMRFERGVSRRIVPLIVRQAKAAADRYEETEDLVEVIRAVDQYEENWEKLLHWHHWRVGEYIGKKFFNSLKSERRYIETKDFDQFRANFREFVKDIGATKVVQVQDTTKLMIKEAVQAATAEGLSGYYVAREIYEKVSGIGKITAKVRSRLIARTETHTGYNSASHMAGLSSGISLEKEWLSAEDDRTRPDHAAMAGQPPIDIKHPFVVGGEEMMYPGDMSASAAQVCNCRCTELQSTTTAVVT